MDCSSPAPAVELEDVPLSFGDSFFNFDLIGGGWLMEGDLQDAAAGACWKMDSEIERQLEKVSIAGENGDGIKVSDLESEGASCLDGNVVKVSDLKPEVEGLDGNVIKVSDLGSEGVIRVSDGGDGNEVKAREEDESCVKSEDVSSSSSSASSSSSSSSSDDDDDDDEEDSGDKKIDVEEGEIVLSDADVGEEMVGWSDIEDDEAAMTGPITSKNEIRDLPPVPSVSVTLQPHHEALPVGVVLSILGAQVIVEGIESHKPLNEGSILWITETRVPLGIIDEIFGPVKNPYYIVRYNTETEVPAGIQQGTSISFVQEFADHVLNDKSLYQKGYDAENDEELSDELEFSDDEKEAEYRRMLKMKKRGTNESKPESKRKEKRQQKNRGGNWNNNRDPTPPSQLGAVTQSQHDNFSGSSGPRQDLGSFPQGAQAQAQAQAHQGIHSGPRQDMSGGNNQAMVSPFSQPVFSPPNGIWNNNNNNTINDGFPPQQQQQQQGMGMGPMNGMPPNGMLWMQQQNRPFQMFQTPLQTGMGMGFQQQMGMLPGLPFNFNAFGGQPNFVGGPPPMLTPWPTTGLDQNTFNMPQFGMGFQGSMPIPMPPNVGGGEPQFGLGFQGSMPVPMPPNVGGGEPQIGVGFQGSLPPPNEQGDGQSQGPQNSGNSQSSPDSSNFSRGTRGGRRGGYQQHHRGGRGRGRFGGGRGRYQNH